MLHAELHSKIAPEASDGERREDVLTSTVFGTIFAAGDWSLLLAWFGKAIDRSGMALSLPSTPNEANYWFWPRLGQTEPDLLIHLGSLLVIIEAKFWSGQSGEDQLVDEWKVCDRPADRNYDQSIRAAIDATTERALVYLVQRRKRAKARSVVETSSAKMPEAKIYLLTWEDLDDVLQIESPVRWRRDLRAYLGMRRITAFRGFASAFATADRVLLGHMGLWRAPRWSRLVHPSALGRLAALAAWQPRFGQKKGNLDG